MRGVLLATESAVPYPERVVRLLLFVSIVLAACGDLAPSRAELANGTDAGAIEFEMAGPGGAALVVPLMINGRGPFEFIVDTGATVTCVDESVVAELGLPDVPGAVGLGAGVGGQGAVRLVAIDSLTLGDATAFDLEACVLDLAHLSGFDLDVDGLVGLNFLRNFHVALDFERNLLHLNDPDTVE